MRKTSRSSNSPHSRRIGAYRAAFERSYAALEKAYPELEKAKIEHAMVLLFGEEPGITDFSDPPPDRPDLIQEPYDAYR